MLELGRPRLFRLSSFELTAKSTKDLAHLTVQVALLLLLLQQKQRIFDAGVVQFILLCRNSYHSSLRIQI